jgi:hypothetical protein
MGFAKPETLDMTEGDDIQTKITKPITFFRSTHPTKNQKNHKKRDEQ